MAVIGLTGYERAGKDYVADLLVRYFDAEKFAFADPLKGMVPDLYPFVKESLAQNFWDWDAVKKKYPDGTRAALQDTGAWVRSHLGPSAFVHALWDRVDTFPSESGETWRLPDEDKGRLVVVSDVRRGVEARSVFDRDGILVWVKNPNPAATGPQNEHETSAGVESLFFAADYVLVNHPEGIGRGNMATVEDLFRILKKEGLI